MKTVIYISRHSQPFRDLLGEYDAKEETQLRNEKNPLSVEGERKAYKLSLVPELKNVEVIYSSHYVRTMATAKYLAEANGIKLNVDERFGERKFGVKFMKDLKPDFFEKQILDWDYKLENGESLNETFKRMKDGLFDLINKYCGKTVMLVSHGTALTSMLKGWCDIKLNFDTKLVELYFNGEKVFDGNWGAPELFRLEFEDDELIDIKNVKVEY